MLKSVTVGAYGWAPVDWDEQYYPGDLPEGWRATYYANTFRTVLLPQAVWQTPGDGLAATLDDLPEGFKCVFELSVPDEQLVATYQMLCGLVEDIIASPEIAVANTVSDDTLQQLQQQTRCHRLSVDQLLSESAGTDYRLAILQAAEPLEPLAMKAVIEQLIEQLKVPLQATETDDDVYLFMDTPYQTLTQIQAMLELYGL